MRGGGRPAFESRPADWLDPDVALARILAAAHTLGTERVPLGSALGRALAEDVVADVTLPPSDNSAMDGYAVRGEDVVEATEGRPVLLRVVGEARPGVPSPQAVAPGGCVRVTTGAPIPPGADSVIRVEHTDREAEPGRVRIFSGQDRGRHVRPGGEDMRSGDQAVARGDGVRPGSVAVLAALGRTDVLVHRRPRVAILATGDELRPASRFEDVRAGRATPDSNGPLLAAAVTSAGCDPVPLGIAPDDPARLRAALASSEGADALVTTGGASMGHADLVKRTLEELGFEQDFWRVKIRPGSPFAFGRLPSGSAGRPVFSLPGNPASAFVTFELFVRPFLLRLAGHHAIHRRGIDAVAGSDLRGTPGLTCFLRVAMSDSGPMPVAQPTGPQGSGLVRGLADARGLAVVPSEAGVVPAGSRVRVILVDDAPGAQSGPSWVPRSP